MLAAGLSLKILLPLVGAQVGEAYRTVIAVEVEGYAGIHALVQRRRIILQAEAVKALTRIYTVEDRVLVDGPRDGGISRRGLHAPQHLVEGNIKGRAALLRQQYFIVHQTIVLA